MPLFNPTSLKLPELTEVLSASRGSIIYFDDPDGVARTQEEMFESGSLLMSNNLFISSSQTKITASDTFEVNGGDVYLHNNLYVTGTSTFLGDSAFTNNVTISGNLTIEGTSTTVDTQNLTIEDPMIMLASNGTSSNQNGGLAILSGSSVTDQSLVIGRVANDMWGVGRLDVTGGTTNDLSSMTPVSFKSSELVLSSGVISGSSDKALEFTATGQLKTIGSAKTATANQLLKYDGTHWVNTSLSAGDNISLDGLSISSRSTVTVTVAGGKFVIDGTSQQTLSLAKGVAYYFDQSDASNSTHPLRFSTTSDGTHNSGAQYTTGVSFAGTPGSAGAYTKVILEQDAPDVLYYYCSAHSGMGGRSENAAAALLIGDRTFQDSLTVTGDLNTSDIVSSTGVISGSNDKAIEFDANGNVTRLTVANPSQHNVLAYDGTKWVASGSLGSGGGSGGIDNDAVASMFVSGSHTNISFEHDEVNDVLNATVSVDDAITVTYAPSPIYARISVGTSYSLTTSPSGGTVDAQFDTEDADTSPNSDMVDLANNQLVVPAGVSKVRITSNLSASDPDIVSLTVAHKRSGSIIDTVIVETAENSYASFNWMSGISKIVDVQQGDTFNARINTITGTSVQVTDTYLEMEVVEGSILNTTVNTTIPDMMTVTYQPSPVYARLTMTSNHSHSSTDSVDGFSGRSLITTFNTRQKDTSDNNLLTSTLADGKFVIPAGVSKVKIRASAEMNNTFSGNDSANKYLIIYKNGQIAPSSVTGNRDNDTGSTTWPSLSSAIIDVVENDYIQLGVHAAYNVNVIIDTNYTWFEMEVVEGSILNTTVNSTISDFTADTLTLSEGVISGSNNKAIEFDADGNILTLTTGSASTNDVLVYDGTKWVADTLQDAITVTYTPDPVYGKMYLATNASRPIGGWQTTPFDTESNDTSPNSDIVDLANNRLVVPAGVTKVRIKGSVLVGISNDQVLARIIKYNSSNVQQVVESSGLDVDTAGGDSPIAFSGILEVQQGDYFILQNYAVENSLTTYGLINTYDYRTWFEMEVVEGSILNTTVNSTISDFTADTLTLSQGVISGSSNKAIEFDSLGNITTLTTGSVVEHNVLAYDGTKWVASASLGSGTSGVDNDAVASMFVSGTHDNITFTYDENNEVINTTIGDLSANTLTLSQGVISGSSNKAIEFDSLGNITTLTTGSVSTNDVLTYDGTKWVADTLQDAISVTYTPKPIFATLKRVSSQPITGNSWTTLQYDTVLADTSPNAVLADTSNNRLVVPAGVDKVKVSVAVRSSATGTSGEFIVAVYHYDASGNSINSPTMRQDVEVPSDEFAYATTSIVSVNQGEYFQARLYSATTQTLLATTGGQSNWFTLEVVEGSILNTTVNSTISDFTADTLTLSEGVISGSSNKAIEFDSLGNITTLTTGSVSTNSLLYYDGAKWDATTSPTIPGSLTVTGDLTVNGTTTTIDTQNLVVEDPLVLLASNSTTSNQDGGLAILSGSSVTDESLVIGRVDTDMWGVGRMDVQSGAVTDLSTMTSVGFKAADLVSTTGVISGSSNKAIEFDSLGNITTLTTGSVSTNDVLTYDGTKWVADTLQDAITVTYQPNSVYARLGLLSDTAIGFINGNFYISWQNPIIDTSPNSNLIDTTKSYTFTVGSNTYTRYGALVVPAGVSKVMLRAAIYADQGVTGELNCGFHHYDSSGNSKTMPGTSHGESDTYQERPMAFSGIVDVVEGDYFVLNIGNWTNYRTIRSNVGITWMEMEVVEGSILNTVVNTTIPDMMTVTYTPSPVYAKIGLSATINNLLAINTFEPVRFDEEDEDTSPNSNLVSEVTKSISGSNRTYKVLSVPAGVTKVRLRGTVHTGTSGNETRARIRQYDSSNTLVSTDHALIEGQTIYNQGLLLHTTTLSVNQGDYFEIEVDANASSYTILAGLSWLEMEVVEGSILNTTVNSTISDFTADTLTLSQGVISGSSDKAIEFDANGNITSFGQSTPSQHDLLAYDGAKWVATGSIDQFFELDANGDLMPI